MLPATAMKCVDCCDNSDAEVDLLVKEADSNSDGSIDLNE
jgi:Ca2+-binding EF-hand superfamily protein